MPKGATLGKDGQWERAFSGVGGGLTGPGARPAPSACSIVGGRGGGVPTRTRRMLNYCVCVWKGGAHPHPAHARLLEGGAGAPNRTRRTQGEVGGAVIQSLACGPRRGAGPTGEQQRCGRRGADAGEGLDQPGQAGPVGANEPLVAPAGARGVSGVRGGVETRGRLRAAKPKRGPAGLAHTLALLPPRSPRRPTRGTSPRRRLQPVWAAG
jgi:hypothetical protein